MNLSKLNIVIGREYLNKVKKKSFLLTTFGVPVLFVAAYALMIYIMLGAKDEAKTVAVSDPSGIVMPFMEDSDILVFKDYTSTPVDSLKNNLAAEGVDILLAVSPLDSVARTVTARTFSEKPLGVESKDAIERRLSNAIGDYRMKSYNISGLEDIISDVKVKVPLVSYTVDEKGNEQISQSEVFMIISMVLAMALYMFIALFSGMVMNSVIEEKSSRVVEVLVSSVSSTELMFGKIIGVALVALTQFTLWIVLSGAIIFGISSAVGLDKLGGSADAAQTVMSMEGMDAAVPGGIDIAALTDTTAVAPADSLAAPTGIEAVFGTVASLNYPLIIFSFLVYFVFGYLLYASLFAAIASSGENAADTQQLQIPITIPLLIGFFIAFYAFKAPDSAIVWWGSVIPFTSPIVMLARIPFGVPALDLILSIGLLILTFVGCAWASAKIYKVGILMYGKKSTFKDLWKWFKQK
ncbi:MAG: ABC transporter permease [Bacteroidales bacterium]|nr:ABC transporter permease [Bacteroidales bacterium]